MITTTDLSKIFSLYVVSMGILSGWGGKFFKGSVEKIDRSIVVIIKIDTRRTAPNLYLKSCTYFAHRTKTYV